ncbi:MAG: ribosomal-protein-alanine N-acetyltransferase [Bacteroidia bacterium]|jgi:ribosomal-protein-alanine N-acetyltransferase
MQIETITTLRLLLRKITPEVMTYVHTTYAQNDLMTFLGATTIEALEKEQIRFAEGLSTYNRKFEYFQLLQNGSDKVVGWCGFHTWYIDHDRAEIGYGLFDEGLKRKGQMTEAMQAILKHGFDLMNLHRVEAFVGKENAASIRLLDNFGFSKEGIFREHYQVDEKNEDSLGYSLLKDEWRK